MTISLEPLEKALKTLESALKTDSPSDLERDGIIFRFKSCLNYSLDLIQSSNFSVSSPKTLIYSLQIAAKEGQICNLEDWLKFLEAKNKINHIYEESIAREIFCIIPKYFQEASRLLEKLKNRVR
jgi:nucleotidyltransferase substrate binding protein (TIGR01987 family)